MTEEEARKLGFTEEVSHGMTEEEARAQGFTEEVTDEAPASEGHALGTFATNALDAASIVGVPSVLAALDEVQFGDKNAPGTGLIDRFRKRRDIYRGAKNASDSEEPVAAVAGQLAPALLPGPKGIGFVKRGATMGGLHGLIGGTADTSGGDLEGTVLDTALGAAGGAAGEYLGAAAGRLTKYAGEKAGRQLESGITQRVRSLLGKYGQKKKDAVAAMKNLAIQENLELAPKVAGPQATPAGDALKRLKLRFPGAEADLYDASQSNAQKQVRRFVGSQKRFGQSAIPDIPYAEKLAIRNMTSASNRALKELGSTAVRVGVGSGLGVALLPQLGFSTRESAAYGGALAGGSRLWAARKLATEIANHPKMIAAMSRNLPAFGERMARVGANTGSVAGYLTALLGTDAGREALDASALEVAEEEGIKPMGYEPDMTEPGVPAESEMDPNSMPEVELDETTQRFKKKRGRGGPILEQPRVRGGDL